MHYDILLTRLTFDQNLSFWFTVRLSFCQFLLHVRSQNQLFFLTDQHLIKTFHSQYFYLLLMLVKSFFYSTNRLIQSSRVMSRNNTGHFKKKWFLVCIKVVPVTFTCRVHKELLGRYERSIYYSTLKTMCKLSKDFSNKIFDQSKLKNKVIYVIYNL